MSNPTKRLLCSFCQKTRDEVVTFISGPDVYICNECVMLCNEILIENEFFTSGILGSVTMKEIEQVSKNQPLNLGEFLKELSKSKPKTLFGLVQKIFRLIAVETGRGLGKEHASLIKKDQRLLKTIRRAEATASRHAEKIAAMRRCLNENATKRRSIESRFPFIKKSIAPVATKT